MIDDPPPNPADKLDPVSHATWMHLAMEKYGLTKDEAEDVVARCTRRKKFTHWFDRLCLDKKAERADGS